MMHAGYKNANEIRSLQAETLRLAATLAKSEESPLAVEYWNHACHRIAQRLETQAAKLEAEDTESRATLERIPRPRHPYRSPLARSPHRGRR
jgi:hypothetical protein